MTMKTTTAAAASATLIASIACAAQTWTADFATPAYDRWMYPFNSTPGTRPTISTFGSEPGASIFDCRDGQMLVAFDTAGSLPTGLGDDLTVTRAVLELEVAGNLSFAYDPTPDPWQTFLGPSDPEWMADADAGQPVELFGVGYRNGFSRSTFVENSPYAPVGTSPLAPAVRNAFAASCSPDGTLRDVSRTPRERYSPVPFAIGAIDGVVAGELVPAGRTMRFELDVLDPGVQRYLRDGIGAGRLALAVTSLTFVQQQSGQFPSFVAKENALVAIGAARAARLIVEATDGPACAPADLNCDGAVNGDDLGELLAAWGPCDACAADLNGDGAVNGDDLGSLLASWG
jgi:hypothetical protein